MRLRVRSFIRFDVVAAAILGAVFATVGMGVAQNSASSERNAVDITRLRLQVCYIIKNGAFPIKDAFYEQNCKKM